MKTGNLICLLLSLAIVGHVVYALLSESEPPRLVSQGKSYTVKELNNGKHSVNHVANFVN